MATADAPGMIYMLAVTAHRISIHNGYAAAAKHKAQSYRREGSELLVSTGLGNLRASECGTSNKVSPSLFLYSCYLKHTESASPRDEKP